MNNRVLLLVDRGKSTSWIEYILLVVDCKCLVLPFQRAKLTFLFRLAWQSSASLNYYSSLALFSLLFLSGDLREKSQPRVLMYHLKCIIVNIFCYFFQRLILYYFVLHVFPEIFKNFAYQYNMKIFVLHTSFTFTEKAIYLRL